MNAPTRLYSVTAAAFYVRLSPRHVRHLCATLGLGTRVGARLLLTARELDALYDRPDQRRRRPRATSYKGETIFSCEQTGIGRCTGTGWHVEQFHEPTNLPFAEEYCAHYPSLREARESITVVAQGHYREPSS